jgi:D-serine dehydratase
MAYRKTHRITGLMRTPKKRSSMFDVAVKSKYRAEIISIKTPAEFRASIKKLLRGRYTVADQRALQLAKNRAMAQLKRKNLSTKEYMEFVEIAKIKIPKATNKPISIKQIGTYRKW